MSHQRRVTHEQFATFLGQLTAEKERYQRRLDGGMMLAALATEFDVSPSTMDSLLKAAGIQRRMANRGKYRRQPPATPTPLTPSPPQACALSANGFRFERALQALMIVQRRIAIGLEIDSSELLPFLPPTTQRTLPLEAQ